jgi:dienelactone hydrolase
MKETLEGRASRIVRMLERGAHAEAVATFDATMTSTLPEPRLKHVWETLLAQAGRLETVGEPHASKRGPHVTVVVPLKFEHARLDAHLSFDAEERLAGLHFLAPEAPYTLPAYADPARFVEREVVVDPGEWKLPGTLTLPKDAARVPAVVLVHGSGPNDRDETIGANKPFRDLAAGLASKGVAVLRYEKRTRVHGAKLASATFTVDDETVNDALAAVALLRGTPEIDSTKIFVAGHSLGGELAPRIGKRDARIAGLVLLAASTRPLGPVMIEQMTYLFSLEGGPTEAQTAKLLEVEAAWQRIEAIRAGTAVAKEGEALLGAPPSYWNDLNAYDAPAVARTVPQRMLVVQGGRDYQVTMTDFEAWRAALAGRKDVTLKVYPTLNHALAAGEGKSTPAEYREATHVDGDVVADLAAWVLR